MATKEHNPSDASMNARVLVDADLWRLADVARFDLHAANVRKEYAQYSDGKFAIGRKQFYQKMLDRQRIFTTETMYKVYETAARRLMVEAINA